MPGIKRKARTPSPKQSAPKKVKGLSRAQAVKETAQLLKKHDIFTPTYFPIEALIAMQKLVGWKEGTDFPSDPEPLQFSEEDRPRVIEPEGIFTPCWSRYESMDEKVDQAVDFGKVPEGMYWGLGEDGSTMVLKAMPKEGDIGGRLRIKIVTAPRPGVGTRASSSEGSVKSTDELTDTGLTDVSSD